MPDKPANIAVATTSKLSHPNGVIYLSSGGSGILMAVDMADGKILWNLESPTVRTSKKWRSMLGKRDKNRWC